MPSKLRFAAGVLASWLVAVSLTTVWAADEAFVGVLALASDPAVAKELGLSEDVLKQLNELIGKREDEVGSLALEIKDLPAAEKTAKLAPFVAESEKQGLALLTAEQQTKLQQIRVQRAGMIGLLDKSIADKVGVTDSQKMKFDIIYQLFLRDSATLPEAEKSRASIELEKKMLAILDKEQRTKWEALTGRVVPELAETTPAGPPGIGRPMGVPGAAAGTTPKAMGPTNASVRVGTPGLKAGDGDVKLKFQFRYAPWKEVIEWFAEQSDFSLVSDVYPTGTFNYADTRAYTPAQALDLLNSVLNTKGYRLVRKERMLFLLSDEDELPDTYAPRIVEADLAKYGDTEIVQCLFQLAKVTAEEAESEVKKMLGRHGKIVVLPKARQIVVTEMIGTLRQIRSTIQAIENPSIPKDEDVTEIKFENIRPSEFMALSTALLGIPANTTAAPDGSLRFSVDELGMRVLVTGKPERIEKVKEIQKLLDVASSTSASGTPIEQPQLAIYSVQKADPAAVLQVLQTLLAGVPDVRLTIDPKTGNLVALCRPTQHKTIIATLDEMQRDATDIEVFKLRRIDPQAAVLQINKLFGGDGDKPAANAPKVDADTTNMQLVVRANKPQIEQIRSLLQKMGEVGGGEDFVGGAAAERKGYRTIPLTGRSAMKVIDQLEVIFPLQHKNKIRVVTPGNKNMPNELRNNFGPPGETPEAAPQGPAPPPKPEPTTILEEARRSIDGLQRPVIVRDEDKDRTARRFIPNSNLQFISQLGAAAEGEKKPAEAAETKPAEAKPAEGVAEAEAPKGPVSVPGAEIVITLTPNGILIVSEDLDALDEMEMMLRQIADQRGGGKEMAIYYLKFAKAQVAATLLQEILSGSGGSSGGDAGGGSLMGDLASSMMGDMGGGLLGGLLGMGGGGGSGGTPVTAGSATITPDIRLNALIVQASSADHEKIEDLLDLLDKPSGPEAVQLVAAPRFIPVLNSTADSIATVVRQVYAGRMTAEGNGQQRQPSPEDFVRALRGGGRGGQNQQANKGEEQKMTVGVDTRTNSLIVAAPDYLFEEVKALVKQLDTAELSSDETVRVVSLRGSNADVITRSLAQVYGESITSSKTTTTGTSTSSRPSSSSSGQRSGGQGGSRGGQNNQSQQAPQVNNNIRQQMEMFNALQGGGRGGRGGGGGGFGGGGGGFGGGGGGRGGR
ncbi:secretin N-terminal domain-containing protein [Anatilimnocola sp. NA78]|uniref:secretin N-terminal domain-containing protein n=1 Tax=Anatilimnocola sp. NA78 TaxID=3415683 RepID=UPI003CE5025E